MIRSFFDYVGHAITSLAAVIFVMLMTISGMVLFSHTLFTSIFPDGMQPWEKLAATWAMALGWELTVLITTCNVKHIHPRIPVVMAICSGVIVLFFIQAFDGNQVPLTLVQRWFVGLLAATINYIYAELFYKKWSERNNFIELPSRVNELESQLNEVHSKLTESQRTVTDTQKELVQLRSFKKHIESELMCPHCKVTQSSPGSLNAHKGHCSMNPRNTKTNDH